MSKLTIITLQLILSAIGTTVCMDNPLPAPVDQQSYPQLQLALQTQKPTIHGKLYINDVKTAHYIHKEKIIKNVQVSMNFLCCDPFKMPFIPVHMTVYDQNQNNHIRWDTTGVPMVILDHEKIIKKPIARNFTPREVLHLKYGNEFPYSLPACMLYDCHYGSQINLTVNGYPVVATCTKHPESKESFPEIFNRLIERLKEVPQTIQFFDQGGCIYIQGSNDNDFVSIECLLFEDKKRMYNSQYNYVMERQLGLKPRPKRSHP